MGQENIPEQVLKLAEKGEIFQQYISKLNSSVNWYNKIKKYSKSVEFDLIENDISEIDKMILTGQNDLNWESQGEYNETYFFISLIRYVMILISYIQVVS